MSTKQRLRLPIVDLAFEPTHGVMSLDWHCDLQNESALVHFDPLSRIEMDGALYERCEHTDNKRFEEWS